MKKRILWFSIALLALLLLTLLIVFAVIPIVKTMMFINSSLWQFSADYKNFADDFNVVKDYVADEYPDESDKWLGVSIHDGETTLYDPELEIYLVLPDDVAESLESLKKNAFPDKDSVLDTIRIQEGRVSFCIENNRYALVYSPEEKPTWMNSPKEDFKVKVKAIKDGWYHVTEDITADNR